MPAFTFLARTLRRLRWSFGDGDALVAQVGAAYAIVLGRPADASGLAAACENIVAGRQTLFDVVQSMYASDERRASVRATVDGLYRSVLGRPGDASGLDFHAARLMQGDVSVAGLAEEFLASDEFGLKFQMRKSAARVVVRTMMVAFTGRDPGPDAIDLYVHAMSHGLTFFSFVDELKRSPEFIAGAVRAPQTTVSNASADLAVLTQELIAAQMTREGCVISLPPIVTLGAAPVSPEQMASLIRTLAMMGGNDGSARAGAAESL